MTNIEALEKSVEQWRLVVKIYEEYIDDISMSVTIAKKKALERMGYQEEEYPLRKCFLCQYAYEQTQKSAADEDLLDCDHCLVWTELTRCIDGVSSYNQVRSVFTNVGRLKKSRLVLQELEEKLKELKEGKND